MRPDRWKTARAAAVSAITGAAQATPNALRTILPPSARVTPDKTGREAKAVLGASPGAHAHNGILETGAPGKAAGAEEKTALTVLALEMRADAGTGATTAAAKTTAAMILEIAGKFHLTFHSN